MVRLRRVAGCEPLRGVAGGRWRGDGWGERRFNAETQRSAEERRGKKGES